MEEYIFYNYLYYNYLEIQNIFVISTNTPKLRK